MKHKLVLSVLIGLLAIIAGSIFGWRWYIYTPGLLALINCFRLIFLYYRNHQKEMDVGTEEIRKKMEAMEALRKASSGAEINETPPSQDQSENVLTENERQRAENEEKLKEFKRALDIHKKNSSGSDLRRRQGILLLLLGFAIPTAVVISYDKIPAVQWFLRSAFVERDGLYAMTFFYGIALLVVLWNFIRNFKFDALPNGKGRRTRNWLWFSMIAMLIVGGLFLKREYTKPAHQQLLVSPDVVHLDDAERSQLIKNRDEVLQKTVASNDAKLNQLQNDFDSYKLRHATDSLNMLADRARVLAAVRDSANSIRTRSEQRQDSLRNIITAKEKVITKKDRDLADAQKEIKSVSAQRDASATIINPLLFWGLVAALGLGLGMVIIGRQKKSFWIGSALILISGGGFLKIFLSGKVYIKVQKIVAVPTGKEKELQTRLHACSKTVDSLLHLPSPLVQKDTAVTPKAPCPPATTIVDSAALHAKDSLIGSLRSKVTQLGADLKKCKASRRIVPKKEKEDCIWRNGVKWCK